METSNSKDLPKIKTTNFKETAIRKIYKYYTLFGGSSLDFALIHHRYRNIISEYETLDKWLNKFYEYYSRSDYEDIRYNSFSKSTDKKLYSPNYKKLNKDIKEFIRLLQECPLLKIKDLYDYNALIKELEKKNYYLFYLFYLHFIKNGEDKISSIVEKLFNEEGKLQSTDSNDDLEEV